MQYCRDARHGLRVERSQTREAGAFRGLLLEIELRCPWVPMWARLHRRERKTGILTVYVPMTSFPLPGGSTLKWEERQCSLWRRWMASWYHAEQLRNCPKVLNTFTLSAAQYCIFSRKLDRFLNMVVVRRARESTETLGPIKDRANFDGGIGTNTGPWATDVNLCYVSRHAKNKI
jgi:hypothetical protein